MTAASRTGQEASRKVPSLTGIRGVAAVVVVVYHYIEAPQLHDSATLREPFAGYLGVDLFFVLSGFLMAFNYGRLFAGPIAWRSFSLFLERRFARVYPLYIVVTLLAFGLAKAGIGGPFHLRTLATNVVLVQQLGAGLADPQLGVSIAGPAWSISTELGAYLLFPLLLRMTVTWSDRVAVATALLSVGALILIATIPWSWKPQGIAGVGPLNVWNGADLWALLRCLADFCLGLLGFRLATRAPGDMLGGEAAGALTAAAAVLCWCIPRADVFAVIAFAALITHLSFERSRVARLLGSRPCLFFGDISYALYLLHFLLIQLTAVTPSGLQRRIAAHSSYGVTATATFLLAIGLSWLSFRLVERPARRLLRSMLEGRRPPPIRTDPPAP